MTKQYKVGDKVLVVGTVRHILEPTNLKNRYSVEVDDNGGWHRIPVDDDVIRTYTPRQEFEYGEVVEVSDNEKVWNKALYVGRSHNKMQRNFQFAVNIITDIGLKTVGCYMYCRKLTNKKETITICGVDYYKDDVEKALKDLKPIKGDL